MSAGEQWDTGPGPGPGPGPMAGPRAKSGAVTAVGIINLIFAGLTVVVAFIMMFAASLIFGTAAGVADELRQKGFDVKGAEAAGGLAGMLAGAAVCVGVVALLIAGLYVLAGLGVLNRKQYGRIITLVLGALHGLNALLNLTAIGTVPVQAILGILISGGYCIFVYMVLLNSQNAAEFR
ncbi:MAG: hypothetical protein L0Z62_25270 [Gemmataceae bacterium]|nr:hypothetical protein [Gemmataceae bacterium]